MIYQPKQRIEPDFCVACNMSEVYCDAVRDTDDVPCCNLCEHPLGDQ